MANTSHPRPRRTLELVVAISTLAAMATAEFLRILWLMPFPGSQQGGTLETAYTIHEWIWPLRLGGAAVVAWATIRIAREPTRWRVLILLLGLGGYAYVAFQGNARMSAEAMFRMPTVLSFASASDTTISPTGLVLGIELEGADGTRQPRAYPVTLIGYHHQVRDVVAGQPVMVTYCTVCRSGRVFSPIVDGQVDDFRLVGMDLFNAMVEDSRTGTWWRQANGEAVVGPRKGERLTEIPSRQMTWSAWLELHPQSDVMEPDPNFVDSYARLAGFEEGTNKGRLTGRNPESWEDKSWVIGVLADGEARAFDWNELVQQRVIHDQVGTMPVVLTLAGDGASFYTFDTRVLAERPFQFQPHPDEPGRLIDQDGSLWTSSGLALDGPLAGTRLTAVPAYQEFWHSWRTFQPHTTARRET